jgi:hypothetical protein
MNNLLILFRHAPFTGFAMLAAQWNTRHTLHAEILIIKYPKLKQLFNNDLLLAPTSHLGEKPRIFKHA